MPLFVDRSRMRKSKKFVPTLGSGVAGHELEKLALTAPAFWRHSPLAPDPADFVGAGVWSFNTTDDDLAYASEVRTNLNVMLTAQTQAQAFDLPDPGSPNSPVPNYTVGFETTGSIDFEVTGPQVGVSESHVTSCGVDRAYILANDTAGSGGYTYLVEHFTIHLEPPVSTSSVNSTDIRVNMHSPSADFTLFSTWGAASFELPTVTIRGGGTLTPTSTPSTISNAFSGGAITYTLTDTDLVATSVTPISSIGTLPNVIRGVDGSVEGLRWEAYSNQVLGMTVRSTGSLVTDTIGLSTTYSAQFTM